MTNSEFLTHLRNLNVEIWADGELLHCNAPKGVLTPELWAELKDRKAEILAFLQEENGTVSPTMRLIESVSRKNDLPLSFAQRRLWFFDQLKPNSAVYNIPMAMKISGPLNIQALQKALDAIVSRHEVLRTTFAPVDGVPVQEIATTRSLELKIIDLSHVPADEREAEVQRPLIAETCRPFNLSVDLMLRGTLLKVEPTEYVLLIVLHHIASDGWSMEVLSRELAALYEAFSGGKPSPLAGLSVQYVDFSVWQRQWFQGKVLETQLSYWEKQLRGIPALQLPTDRPRPAIQTFRGKRQSLVLPNTLSDDLKSLSGNEGVTLFMTMLAAFQVLLYRYTGQEDIGVGSPIANRTRPEVEGLIGFFANTLVLRTDLSGKPSFRELLARVRKVALDAYENQDLPFETLVEKLNPDRDLSQSPFFQAMFVLQNSPISTIELSGLTVSFVHVDNATTKFDLTLLMVQAPDSLTASLEYNTDLFDAATIRRMLGHFEVLLGGIVANPDQRLSELPILTAAERQQILVEWNNTKRDYPNDECIHDLFEAQVERTPDTVAVVFEGEQLTYRELNCRANQLAHYLRKLGVSPDVLVGICVERSLEMIVGLLAILKAGGAYVPLDPAFPKERLAFKMKDAGLKLVVTQHRLAGELPKGQLQTICLDTDWGAVAKESRQNPCHHAAAQNRAYVIYTSGSTGKPKGVEITHDAVVNFLRSMREQPGLTDQDVLLAVTTVSFDIAGLELYLPLIVGARVVIVSREVAADGARLMKYITQAQATVMQATPATWRMLLSNDWQGGKQLRILCGGEALPGELADQLLERGASLWNLYGPTESTIWSTLYRVEAADSSTPIGRPIANTKVYVLDHHLGPVPIGVPGELHIGGAGLARGYLNRPELTAEKFIPNPFSDAPGERLYKTGDLARYLPDGNIELLSRIDYQVKIRGFRIELGEIEAALCQHPNIRETVVVAQEDVSGEKRLVGYVVPSQESAPTIRELRNFLQTTLPDYMVPSAIVFLDSLPLTPNGKIDRRALPPLDGSRDLISTFAEPRNDVERQLVRIWQEVLMVDRIGTRDNFFEIGGHSLLAARMFAKLERCLKVRVPLAMLFQTPTIEGLAAAIGEERVSEPWRSLVPIQPAGSRPPLFAVPGVGGNVLGLYDLARLLGPEQPFYGLQSRGLSGTEKPLTSIEEIAAAFLAEIREVQREGPYFLLGGCMGGIVAYEMAQQLHAAGKEVGLLVLVETPLPERTSEQQPRHLVRMFAALHLITGRLRLYIQTLARLRGRQRFEYLLERLKMLAQMAAQRDVFRGDRTEFYLQVVTQANVVAFQRYQPRVYPGHVILIRDEDRKVTSDEDPRLAWSRLAAGGLEIHHVPGDDSGLMLMEQNAAHLARQLITCLEECKRKSSRTQWDKLKSLSVISRLLVSVPDILAGLVDSAFSAG